VRSEVPPQAGNWHPPALFRIPHLLPQLLTYADLTQVKNAIAPGIEIDQVSAVDTDSFTECAPTASAPLSAPTRD
jgi:hypothetical protein